MQGVPISDAQFTPRPLGGNQLLEGSAELRETVARRRPLLIELVESCETLGEVTACLERQVRPKSS